ncbi:hypothetical protein CDAR_98561 [Caerostris darwini]|uniref:Uncharacterized protein n=1 Tax=Caerostris darwini TaxID=1538125 RepID=A0AAV4UFS8_9ARAC|nr:hypothetical protein CDAR_98561 [Caerostris darwini]
MKYILYKRSVPSLYFNFTGTSIAKIPKASRRITAVKILPSLFQQDSITNKNYPNSPLHFRSWSRSRQCFHPPPHSTPPAFFFLWTPHFTRRKPNSHKTPSSKHPVFISKENKRRLSDFSEYFFE